MSEVEKLRAALEAILAVNVGERMCAYSWGQEYYKRSVAPMVLVGGFALGGVIAWFVRQVDA